MNQYEDITFQGKPGSLTLSDEKILFQAADPDVAPRSWLWSSMSRCQVLKHASTDKRIVKISNHANKAVSFLVPESALSGLQKDIDTRLAAAKGEEVPVSLLPKEPSISAEKAMNMVAAVESIKKARQNRKQPEAAPTSDASEAKKTKIEKSKSFDEEALDHKLNKKAHAESKPKKVLPAQEAGVQSKSSEGCIAKKQPVRRAKSLSENAALSTGQKAGAEAKSKKPAVRSKSSEGCVPTKLPVRRAKSLSEKVALSKGQKMDTESKTNKVYSTQKPATRSKSKEGCVVKKQPVQREKSLSESAALSTEKSESKEAGHNSFSGQSDDASFRTNKPGKVSLGRTAQAITKELFIRPGQQLARDLVRPANDYIVKPTNRKIVQPAKEKIVKPTHDAAQKAIVKPTMEVAQTVMHPAKVIAQDVGLMRKPDAATGESSSTRAKPGLLHFLKKPQRRTFDDEDDISFLAQSAVVESSEPEQPAKERKSAGKTNLSSFPQAIFGQ